MGVWPYPNAVGDRWDLTTPLGTSSANNAFCDTCHVHILVYKHQIFLINTFLLEVTSILFFITQGTSTNNNFLAAVTASHKNTIQLILVVNDDSEQIVFLLQTFSSPQ